MAEERAQRRLAAVLAADVVGYSRLMEQDEAGTLALLKSRRKAVLEPLVAKHQGRIFKITGDGVLVEFGSAVNAVQCAIDLQQDMATANLGQADGRHIVLRIGVNLGDVIVEGSDLYGDGVNVSARLEAMCQPGGIISIAGVYGGLVDKIPMGPAMNKSLTFRMGQTHVNRWTDDLVRRIEEGQIDPSFVITHTAKLEDGPDMYKVFRNKQDGCVKVVLKP